MEEYPYFIGRYNKKGKWIIEEVKKVRPYLETEVVKVKKKEKPEVGIANRNDKNWEYISDKDLIQLIDTAKGQLKKRANQQGNWVNGENLDKIKFPCLCSYSDGEGSERKKGFFSASNGYYYMADITNQKKVQNDVGSYSNCHDLKTFVRENNVHILKGKITIYEEE